MVLTADTVEQLEKYAIHLSNLVGTNMRIVDLAGGCMLSDVIGAAPYFAPHCGNPACSLASIYAYGCAEAYRWGGKYVFYCHEGLAFVAASVSDKTGELVGGLVAGPIAMGEMEDVLEPYRGTEKEGHVAALCNLPPRKVHDLAELLAGITELVSGVGHSIMGSISYRQEDILQSLYDERRASHTEHPYPYEAEKRLMQCIRGGDKHGATAVLNELLAEIFFISNYDMELIRIRILELLTVLSRATIDAGADSKEIFWFSTGCIKEMNQCRNIYDLSVWITGILYRFISYSFDFSSVKHSDTVYKVVEYIRENYAEKITLDDVAGHVNFSKTYLSRIFKEEIGENMSFYINRVRIEKAKILLGDSQVRLIDVANRVGFDDQSYFTKVFKSIVGTSPKRFKEKRDKN